MFTVYQLECCRGEYDADGEDFDEWFRSLAAARKRRAALIRENPGLKELKLSETYGINRVVLAHLPARELALAILNRRKFIRESTTLVEPYCPPRKRRKP
jgi:hypothetical protein